MEEDQRDPVNELLQPAQHPGEELLVKIFRRDSKKANELRRKSDEGVELSASFAEEFWDDVSEESPTTNQTGLKNPGLTLDSLKKFSPPMVTLQSLGSDWPPNTVDSGYNPSPMSGDVKFSYSCEDDDYSERSNYSGRVCDSGDGNAPSIVIGESSGNISPVYSETRNDIGGSSYIIDNDPENVDTTDGFASLFASAKARSKPCFSSSTEEALPDHKERYQQKTPPADQYPVNKGSSFVTPTFSRITSFDGKSPLSATPPIAIPGSKVINHQSNKGNSSLQLEQKLDKFLTKDEDRSVSSKSVTNPNIVQKCDFVSHTFGKSSEKKSSDYGNERKVIKESSMDSPRKLSEDDSDELSNISDSPTSYFSRPRTYSCPESSRSTPLRPSIPLFLSPELELPRLQDVNSKPHAQHIHDSHENVLHVHNLGLIAQNALPSQTMLHPAGAPSKKAELVHQAFATYRKLTSMDSVQPVARINEVLNHSRGSLNLPTLANHPLSGASNNIPPGGFGHSRNRSTPATSSVEQGNQRHHMLPPVSAGLHPASSREAIVDLSVDGPGHRRRVLVLALPDVVVDTNMGRMGPRSTTRYHNTAVNSRADARNHPGGRRSGTLDRSNHDAAENGRTTALNGRDDDCMGHARQDSNSEEHDEWLPFRQPSSRRMTHPHINGPPRRSWTRPRALSCDVTLEETVGTALRRIADDFEETARLESNTFLGRVRRTVRRSFSRILNGSSTENLTREQVNSERQMDEYLEQFAFGIGRTTSSVTTAPEEPSATCPCECPRRVNISEKNDSTDQQVPLPERQSSGRSLSRTRSRRASFSENESSTAEGDKVPNLDRGVGGEDQASYQLRLLEGDDPEGEPRYCFARRDGMEADDNFQEYL